MTQKIFNAQFKKECANWQVRTLTDRRLLYNDYMEACYQSGQITKKQNETWGHPHFLTTNKNKIDCSAY